MKVLWLHKGYDLPASSTLFPRFISQNFSQEINHQDGPCRHDDKARALTGVWASTNLNKALDLGYRLVEIIKVWHFEKQSSSIFVDYICTFLKSKQEASGYPLEATDRESREKYIRDYQTHQGNHLDPDKIEVNPTIRQMSKFCLNCLLGKFAQKSNLTQTILICYLEEFLCMLFSACCTASSISTLSMMTWRWFSGITKTVASYLQGDA